MNLASQVRHFLTFLAGLGGLFLSWNLIAPEQVAEVNKAGADLIDPIMILIGAVAAGVARLVIGWISSLIGRGAGGIGEKLRGIPVWLGLIGTAVALGTVLPSCSVGEYPITGSITYRDEATGAKAGLTFYPPVRKVRTEK
jgi:hypothetical protein